MKITMTFDLDSEGDVKSYETITKADAMRKALGWIAAYLEDGEKDPPIVDKAIDTIIFDMFTHEILGYDG